MKKISILVLHLGYGGVERSISTLSNMLADIYEIEIISVYKLLDKPAFDIDKRVKIRYLLPNLKPNGAELKTAIKDLNIANISRQSIIALKVLWNRKYKIIKEIKELDADIVISTRVLFTRWLSKYGNKNIIKIAQEHRHHNNNKKYIKLVINACKNIDYLMPVSKELTNFYSKLLKNNKTKCLFIPQALEYIPDTNSALDQKNIISIGRLSKEKGFITLIDVFKLVNDKYPDWTLNVIGDGIERKNIEAKIKEHNLSEKIVMHGYCDREYIEKQLLNTSIYVMTSYEESFGLVLIEAESFGIPCIAFDSAQGATEIIRNNKNGYLIKQRNITEMSEKIIKLIEDIKLRKAMGQEAKKDTLKYSKEIISKKWYDFIKNISR